MTSINPKDRLDAIEVIRLSDDDAVQWLKTHKHSGPNIFSENPEDERHKIASFAFARRGSSRLRLAVARYGSHIPSLRRLFREGTHTERLAVLANLLVGPAEHSFLKEEYIITGEEALEILRKHQTRMFHKRLRSAHTRVDLLVNGCAKGELFSFGLAGCGKIIDTRDSELPKCASVKFRGECGYPQLL